MLGYRDANERDHHRASSKAHVPLHGIIRAPVSRTRAPVPHALAPVPWLGVARAPTF